MYKILLVDDDLGFSEGVVYRLERLGYSMLHAETEEKMDKILVDERVNLVMLDVMLTDPNVGLMDSDREAGLRIAKRLGRSRPDLPILLITSRSDITDTDRQTMPTVKGVLSKPFTGPELLRAIGSPVEE